jgi:hypothetical protein
VTEPVISAELKAKIAVLAAFKVWAGVCLVLLAWATWVALSQRTLSSLGDAVFFFVLLAGCSGLVMFATVIGFFVPYVCLRSTSSTLRRRWRMYFEPCIIAAAVSFLLGHRLGAMAYTLWRNSIEFLVPALAISLIISYLYVRDLRRRTRPQLSA